MTTAVRLPQDKNGQPVVTGQERASRGRRRGGAGRNWVVKRRKRNVGEIGAGLWFPGGGA